MTQDLARHHVLEASDTASNVFGDNLFVPTQVAMHAIDNELNIKEPVALMADEITRLALKINHPQVSARTHIQDQHQQIVPVFLLLGQLVFATSVYKSFRENVRESMKSQIHPHKSIAVLRDLLMLPEHPRGLGHSEHILDLHTAVVRRPDTSHHALRDLLHGVVGHVAGFGATTRPGLLMIDNTRYIIVRHDHADGTEFQITHGRYGASTSLLHTRPYTKTPTR